MKKIVVLLMLMSLCFCAVGCNGEPKEVQSIDVSSSVLASFECTLRIKSIEPYTGEERAVFKPTITKDDIVLGDALKGKTVKSVTFIDKHNIDVVLDGTATFEHDQNFGSIKVLKNALENNYDAIDYLAVEKAFIYAESAYSDLISGTYVATYTLAAGSFTENISKDSVRIIEEFGGRVDSVTLENGRLTVAVSGAADCPMIELDKNVTSFNKEIRISLHVGSKVTLE